MSDLKPQKGSPFTDILLKSLEIPETDGTYIHPITETHHKWAADIEKQILQVIAEAIGEITDPNHRHFNAATGNDEQCILVSEIRAKLGIPNDIR